MAAKLRTLVFATFNQTGSTGQQSNFSELYSHVHKMTVLKSRPTVYQVVQECLKQWFDAFATSLAFSSRREPGSVISSASAKEIFAYYDAFFGGTLVSLSAGISFAERQAKYGEEKKMLLSELVSRCFTQSVLCREPVKQYITEMVQVFFSRIRELFNKNLLSSTADEGVVSKAAINEYFASNIASHEEVIMMCNLLKMLVRLDPVNLSIFHRFVQLPLALKSVALSQRLASEQLKIIEQTKSIEKDGTLVVIHYLHWLTNYLTVDQHILESQFGFDRRAAEMLGAISAHQMAKLKMAPLIIGHPAGGFNVLLISGDRPKLAALYRLLVGLHSRTGQSALLKDIEQHIEQHFVQLKGTLSSKFNFKRRTDQVAFAEELQALKHKWDGILREVFPISSADTRSEVGTEKIDQIVFLFFHSTLQLGEAVPQALAFYMHNLMLVKMMSCSSSSNRSTSKPSLQELNNQFLSCATLPSWAVKLLKFPMSVSQVERFAALYHLLTLLQYMKDANSFFEYCKHFFCTRLLMSSAVKGGGGGSGSNTACIFSLNQELTYFDLLIEEIKRVFVDGVFSVPKSPTGELLHKQFTQNLGDFQAICKSWINSEKGYRGFLDYLQQPQQQPQPVVDSFRIANLGTWKLATFERCQLPAPMEAHFREVEALYQAKHKGRRLMLNTAAGKATINAAFWKNTDADAQPLSLSLSLHQLAILEQFNHAANNSSSSLSYEQLLKGGRFQVENNAKLAILSLVYCGLLKVIGLSSTPASSALQVLKFAVDDSQHFYNANKELATDGKTKDLSTFEQVNFWSGEGRTVDLKTSKLMAALGVSAVDIHLEAAEKAVEDVYANCSIILRRRHQNLAIPFDSADDAVAGASSSSAVHHSMAIISCVDTALDRQVKIEAATVRVVKQARHFKSMSELYQAIKEHLFTTSKAPFPPTDRLTLDEVNTIVVDLIDKKFIKRTQNGGFEYLLE